MTPTNFLRRDETHRSVSCEPQINWLFLAERVAEGIWTTLGFSIFRQAVGEDWKTLTVFLTNASAWPMVLRKIRSTSLQANTAAAPGRSSMIFGSSI